MSSKAKKYINGQENSICKGYNSQFFGLFPSWLVPPIYIIYVESIMEQSFFVAVFPKNVISLWTNSTIPGNTMSTLNFSFAYQLQCNVLFNGQFDLVIFQDFSVIFFKLNFCHLKLFKILPTLKTNPSTAIFENSFKIFAQFSCIIWVWVWPFPICSNN